MFLRGIIVYDLNVKYKSLTLLQYASEDGTVYLDHSQPAQSIINSNINPIEIPEIPIKPEFVSAFEAHPFFELLKYYPVNQLQCTTPDKESEFNDYYHFILYELDERLKDNTAKKMGRTHGLYCLVANRRIPSKKYDNETCFDPRLHLLYNAYCIDINQKQCIDVHKKKGQIALDQLVKDCNTYSNRPLINDAAEMKKKIVDVIVDKHVESVAEKTEAVRNVLLETVDLLEIRGDSITELVDKTEDLKISAKILLDNTKRVANDKSCCGQATQTTGKFFSSVANGASAVVDMAAAKINKKP